MERSSTKGSTMVSNQLPRRQFKPRRQGSGRVTTLRPINFDTLLLSGKMPAPPTSSRLNTNMKENENPQLRLSCEDVDNVWEAERRKRISALAWKKLTRTNKTPEEINNEPVEERHARNARLRRGGGKSKPCQGVYSSVFKAALKALPPPPNTRDDPDKTVPGTCSPVVKTTHKQVEVCSIDGELKEKTRCDDNQVDHGQSLSSLEDMDVSSGEYGNFVIQNIMNPHDCTPDLASLMEMDWNVSSPPPRIVLENALNSQGSPLQPQQEDTRRENIITGKDGQGNASALPMQGNLGGDASCANEDGTPHHDSKEHGTHTTSPAPPSNPLAVYMTRRRLSKGMCKSCQRKLPFGSSTLHTGDIGEFIQNMEVPDPEFDWDSISCGDDPGFADAECDHEVHVAPHKGTKSEINVCDGIQSQESCSMHGKTSIVKSESLRRSGSNISTESLKGKSVVSLGVDGAQTSTITPRKLKQVEKAGLSKNARALFLEGPSEETPRLEKPLFSPIKSVEKTRLQNQSVEKLLGFEGDNIDNLGVCELPIYGPKPVTNQPAGETELFNQRISLNFEDAEMEGRPYNEKCESIIEEPQEPTELKVSSLDSSQPSANLQNQPDDSTTETQTCPNLQNQRDEIICGTQPCTNPRSQADIIPDVDETQAEPLKQPQVKRTRRKDQKRRCSLEGNENGLTWENGVRRSQRKRVRPLQWWRGRNSFTVASMIL